MLEEKFDLPNSVEITSSRWQINIIIEDLEGKIHMFIASADSGLTWGDGIWFGTGEEYDEAIERV